MRMYTQIIAILVLKNFNQFDPHCGQPYHRGAWFEQTLAPTYPPPPKTKQQQQKTNKKTQNKTVAQPYSLGSWIEQTWINTTLGYFYKRNNFFYSISFWKEIKENSSKHTTFSLFFPLHMECSLFFNSREFLLSKKTCAKFCWNRPSGFEVEYVKSL